MLKKLYYPAKNIIPAFIILFSILNAGEYETIVTPFHIESENKHSIIVFDLPPGWESKLLNKSPAAKILIKLINRSKTKSKNWVIDGDLDPNTGLKHFRILPIDAENSLLVIELRETMKFGSHPDLKSRYILHDEKYYDLTEWYYLQGLAHHRKGRLKEALTEYRKAVFRNRKHGNAYYKAGQIRFAFKQYRLAEINYKHAERLQCDSVKLYLSLAELYQRTGKSHLEKKYNAIYADNTSKNRRNDVIFTETNALPGEMKKNDSNSENDTNPPLNEPEDKEVKTIMEEQDHRDYKSSTRIIFYIISTAVLFIFILVNVSLVFLKRKKRMSFSASLPDFEDEFSMHKGRILKAAKLAARARESRQLGEMIQLSEKSGNELLSSNNIEHETENETENESVKINAAENLMNKSNIARNLNLGVGEIELALNLTSHQRQAQKRNSIHSVIENLYDRNVEIPEIARQMNLGQGEVELLLTMKREELKDIKNPWK